MKTLQPLQGKLKEKQIAKILRWHRYKGHWEDSESYDMTDTLAELLSLFSTYHKEELKRIKDKNFEFMEPCEPDCTKERHARHKGSWDHYVKLDELLEEILKEFTL